MISLNSCFLDIIPYWKNLIRHVGSLGKFQETLILCWQLISKNTWMINSTTLPLPARSQLSGTLEPGPKKQLKTSATSEDVGYASLWWSHIIIVEVKSHCWAEERWTVNSEGLLLPHSHGEHTALCTPQCSFSSASGLMFRRFMTSFPLCSSLHPDPPA